MALRKYRRKVPLFLSSTTSVIILLFLALLIVWRLVARARRLIGRQRLSPGRAWFAVILFPTVIVALLLSPAAAGTETNVAALAAGTGIGVALGLIGLALTRFEACTDGLFYTPNAYLGMALVTALLARIAYRFTSEIASAEAFGMVPDELIFSPITLVIFGTLAGYYFAYSAGLLRWRMLKKESPPA